jgi:RNA polymerase sigma-70 factor (ECF subfamily)
MGAYRKGDERAFTILFGRYSARLTAFLRYRLGSRKKHLVEEIYQKTWLKLHAGRKSFDPDQKFSTWFYTIALNTLRDELGSRYEKTPHDEVSETLVDPQPTGEERYLSKEAFLHVEALLKFLTGPQKTALLLSDGEELSSKEIAEVMRISDASVRQLVSRARRVIREKAEEIR